MEIPDMPGLDEASKLLDAMEAADTAAAKGQYTQKPDPDGSANADATDETAAGDAQRAEQAGKGQGTDKTKTETGTQAEGASQKPADQKAAEEKAAGEKPQDKGTPEDKGKSRYNKAQERLRGGWDELNATKDALKAEREAFTKEREALETQRREFEQQRKDAEEQFSPEAYEGAAKKFEENGQFDLAELARKRAADLRKNPPAPKTNLNAEKQKEWTLKAGVDFPELSKQNSALQVRVARMLQEDPELKAHPRGVYLAARFADVELQAEKGKQALNDLAARNKELETAKARITELEKLTAPGGGDGLSKLPGPKSFDQMNSAEQEAELNRMASEVGAL